MRSVRRVRSMLAHAAPAASGRAARPGSRPGPGALVGFLGPKVYEALNGRPFRPGVQVAENLAAAGVIDAAPE